MFIEHMGAPAFAQACSLPDNSGLTPLGALLSLIREQSDAREGKRWGSMSDTSLSSSSSSSNPPSSGSGSSSGGGGGAAAANGNSSDGGSGGVGDSTTSSSTPSVVLSAYVDDSDVEHTLSILLDALYVHRASSGTPITTVNFLYNNQLRCYP